MDTKMTAELSDAAAKAAKLALEMGSSAADAITVMEALGLELPFLEPVLKTIQTIREKVDTVKRNRDEVESLEERCTYTTACVIEKHRLMPDSEKDATPLQNCVDAVEAFVELCGGMNNSLGQVAKAFNDTDEIAGLNARVDRLAGDLQLTGIVAVEGEVAQVCLAP